MLCDKMMCHECIFSHIRKVKKPISNDTSKFSKACGAWRLRGACQMRPQKVDPLLCIKKVPHPPHSPLGISFRASDQNHSTHTMVVVALSSEPSIDLDYLRKLWQICGHSLQCLTVAATRPILGGMRVKAKVPILGNQCPSSDLMFSPDLSFPDHFLTRQPASLSGLWVRRQARV